MNDAEIERFIEDAQAMLRWQWLMYNTLKAARRRIAQLEIELANAQAATGD